MQAMCKEFDCRCNIDNRCSIDGNKCKKFDCPHGNGSCQCCIKKCNKNEHKDWR